MKLVEVFLGDEVHVGEGGGQGINELARFFAKDELPEARQSIASRIVTELKGMKRLCPSSIDDEFKMLRQLGNKLVRGKGKYLSHEDLLTAFQERSKRLVTHEPLLQFMQTAKTSDARLERLLVVEENIVGAENKRTLSTFMIPIISSNGFEDRALRRFAGAAAPAPRGAVAGAGASIGFPGGSEDSDRGRAGQGGATHRGTLAIPRLDRGACVQSN